MKRSIQISLILLIVLGLGLVYINHQVNSVRGEVEEIREMNAALRDQIGHMENLIIEVGVTIDNGTSSTTETVRLIKGASSLEALHRVATVGTNVYPGQGIFIESINGISNDPSSQTYWMIYRLENNSKWKQINIAVNKYEPIDGDNIKFSYEQASW